MATSLTLLASPYGAASRGAALAAQASNHLCERDPSLNRILRDVSSLGTAQIGRGYSDALLARQPHDCPAFALSKQLIREVEEADTMIIATPMHNYTVPAGLKVWIDLVLRHGRSFVTVNGVKQGRLKDRPVLVVVTSGSRLVGEGATQPDHLTAYLRDVLKTVGITDVRFVYLDGLAHGATADASMAAGARQLAADPVFGVGPAACDKLLA